MARQNSLFQEIYDVVCQIPSGKVATYGQIAAIVGIYNGARIVGWALSRCPKELNVPCHRVVNRKGQLAPSHVFGGYEVQRAILETDGVSFRADGTIDMEKSGWKM